MTAEHLRCEYLVDPLAVGPERPRLSWELRSDQPSDRQTGWQVDVSQGGIALWDSGRVAGDQQNQIEYAGRPLRCGEQATWRVRVWDSAGRESAWSAPARWGAGPRTVADWHSAQWIATPEPVQPWTPGHNGYHSTFSATADTPKWVQVDLGEARTVDAVQVHPARPYDWHADVPGFLFPVRFRVEGGLKPDLSDAKLLVDRTTVDQLNPGLTAPRFEFAAVAVRYIRLTATRLALRDGDQHALALGQLRVFAGADNVALRRPVTAADDVGGTWSPAQLTDGHLTSQPASQGRVPATLLRHEFTLAGPVRRARAYVTARGLYELSLNGRRVGEQILAPEWTDYHQRQQYQAYDVTGLLKAGANAVGALLGDGWYAGRIGLAGIVPGGPPSGLYGSKPQLLATLVIDLADGTQTVVATDPSWRTSSHGPVAENDLLDGEAQDARRALPGWDAPGFATADWPAAEAVALDAVPLVPQPNEPIRVIRELTPVALTEPQPGTHIFDLGQNMVGWVRLRLTAPAGTAVVLHYGEMLKDDGTLYTENLRGAPQIDRYICRGGGEEVFEPHFTYHGFRYVAVTGLPAKPRQADLTGRVFCSSSPDVGAFECSAAPLNRLWQNILWTQRANLMSSPTDCPQRDERLGWMGDIQSFSQTAIFNQDMAGFFTKWLPDVRDAQAADGRYPDFAPHPFGPNERFSAAPAWGDAGVVVPWRMYQNYGDTRLLSEHFASAQRWVDYVAKLNPDHIWRHGRGNDYNDWLNGDTLILDDYPKSGGEVPRDVFATAFWYHSTDLVARMAAVLGHKPEAERYGQQAAAIKAAFNQAFVTPDGRITGDTQAGYALALHFDLLPEALRPLAVEHLVAAIERYGRRISTGIQTTNRMMLELVRWGHADLAWELLQSHKMPGWLYSLDQGSTTIWERWDGYVKGRGFQNPGMNSFNHWALGAVGEWLYRVVLGLNPDEAQPGWRHFTAQPRPGGGVTWAKGSYHSIRGPIAVSWRVEGGKFSLELTVPPGCTATVRLPDGTEREVGSGVQRL